MESSRVKIGAFLLVVLATGACLGVVVLKFNSAAQAPESALSPAQKLRALEGSSGRTGAPADTFLERERERHTQTREAEKAVFE